MPTKHEKRPYHEDDLDAHAAEDLNQREIEVQALSTENAKLERENRELIHKLNKAMG